MLKNLLSLFTKSDLYIQIAENRLRVIRVANGDEFNQAPLMALEEKGGKVVVKAVGDDAAKCKNQAGVEVVNPFSHPRLLVADFQKAEKVLMHAFQTLFAKSWFAVAPRVVVQPMEKLEGGLTDIELRVFRELCLGAGAREVVVYVGTVLPWQDFNFADIKAKHCATSN